MTLCELTFFNIPVCFPFKNPYPAQKSMMAFTIKSLINHENACLESCTGTGKTVAILAASLAYQEKNNVQMHGSGTADLQAKSMMSKKHKIWFATRTHTQLKQLVSELKKLPYEPQLAIIASKQQYCVNKSVLSTKNVDDNCPFAKSDGVCLFKKKGVPKEFKPGGVHAKFDIEDLKAYGEKNHVCPYFLSREMLKDADLIFTPYNFILDPIIKDQMNLNFAGDFLIFDEAHNVDSFCRDVGNFRFTFQDIEYCLMISNVFLKKYEPENPKFIAYKRIIQLLTQIHTWINVICPPQTFQNLDEVFAFWGMNFSEYQVISKHFAQLNSDSNAPLPLRLLMLTEHLCKIFKLAYRDTNSITDFRIVVDMVGKQKTVDILEMNPGGPFLLSVGEASSIILTSGTLSPLTTYESELGVAFTHLLSAPHVIGKDQIIAFTVSKGVGNIPMLSTVNYLSMNMENIISSLGKTIDLLTQIIPNGVLFFLPNYSLLTNLIDGWKANGIYEKINSRKKIFIESQDSSGEVVESFKRTEEAILIGVIRGRASEGIDFSDEQCRAVIVFGVPFPSVSDPKIVLKKEYNNSTKSPNSGAEWYNAITFRSVAQAIGRTIRHVSDYGAIILLDERYSSNIQRFPKWIPFQEINSVEDILQPLTEFYKKMFKPKVQSISKYKNVQLFCQSCKSLLLEIENPQNDSTEDFLFGGFATTTKSSDEKVYKIPKGWKKQMHGVSMPITFDESDRMAYSPFSCKCGLVCGATIVAASLSNARFLDSLVLVVSRIFALMNDDYVPLSSITKNSLKVSLRNGGGGQTRIVFS